MLEKQWQQDKLVCVGLDTDYRKIPQFLKTQFKEVGETMFAFNKAIIDLTKDFTGTYKLQSSYYEAYGEESISAIKQTTAYIRKVAPEIPLIVDAKRADIGSTNEGYVQTIFDQWGFDAVTLHPYLGGEALQPFLEREDNGLIILCRTSNPGAPEFQDLVPKLSDQQLQELLHGPAGEFGKDQDWSAGMPLYMYVGLRVVNHWNTKNNCALVVGATYPEEAQQIRQTVGDIPFLIPGIGAQGGDLKATVASSKNSTQAGMIINSSRGIIFASTGEDFAEKAAEEAKKLNDQINQYRKEGK